MIKRIAGIVLFLIGIYLSFSLIMFLLKIIFLENKDVEGQDQVYTFSYYFGQIVVIILFGFIGYKFLGVREYHSIVQDKIYLRIEAMDLIDKQHIIRFEIG